MSLARSLGTYVLVAFGWAWLCWVPFAMVDRGIAVPAPLDGIASALVDYGAWGPLVASLVVSYREGGRDGVKRLAARMLRFRFGWRWYLAAILLYPTLIAASLLVAVGLGDPVPEMPYLAQPLILPIVFVVIFFNAGPLQEEAGWRGIVQDRLQSRWSALWSSVMVGLLWGVWHLPLFFMERQDIYYQRPIWGLIVSTVLASILFAWVYNGTGGSLFAAMLMHASFNWAHVTIPTLDSDRASLALFALQGLVIALVLWRWGPRLAARDVPSARAP